MILTKPYDRTRAVTYAEAWALGRLHRNQN